MMRFVLAIALLIASTVTANAMPLHGGGGVPVGCVPWSGTSTQSTSATPGDTICFSTPSRILTVDFFGSFQLSGVQASFCPAGNSTFTQNQGGPGGNTATGCAATVVYCNTQANSINTGIVSFALVAGSATRYQNDFHNSGRFVNTPLDETAHCAPIFNQYLLTRGASTFQFSDATSAIFSALAGDVLTFHAAPALNATGGWTWPSQMNITTAGLTINMDATFLSSAPIIQHPPGVGSVLIQAANTTLTGGGTSYANGATFQSAVWKIYDNASNPTITGVTIQDCGDQLTGMLAGHDLQTVTITNVTIQRCGIDSSGNGQYHNFYFGIDPGVSPTFVGDTAENLQITGIWSLNMIAYVSGGASIPLKMRPMGTAAKPNHVTQSMLGCSTTASLGAGVSCDTNGVMNMPCGGYYLVDFSTLERPPNADNWFMVRAMEDIVSGLNCPNNASTTPDNIFTFDHDIFVWDGQPQPFGSGFTQPVLMCIGNGSTPPGANCGAGGFSNPPAQNPHWNMTNSVIVGDPGFTMIAPGSFKSAGIGCTLSGGTCTDANNNRWYTNRAQAGAAEHWAAMDAFGNPCCGFPYLPAHM